jgi:hypothetical protein
MEGPQDLPQPVGQIVDVDLVVNVGRMVSHVLT